ncbi:ROK family transcriptional regulator [Rhodohalobacter sp. SW132]|uniref:ROK family transcriptional regulator n=1 Tax=Rhodohalobacter sp. SW132 TaxID=2293433 RepID=UPI000E237CD1|nr:ROK family transcriptional regulator [Rhodohalobacter sp. SW132]REL24946.1 ROK family transcriptional regulator [Rhodohalobacter sp. SW132]
MLQGTNLQYANSFNIRIVIEAIRLYGPVSRGEVAKRTRLTAQTVTNITKKLMKGNLIVEGDRVQEGRGAPSILLSLNKDAAFSIGLDLDKDHLTGVLIDLDGNMRQRTVRNLKFPKSDEGMAMMEEIVNELLEKEGVAREKIWGVGVGLPGPMVISEGTILKSVVNPQFLPGWDNVPVVKMLQEKLELPVYLENNASAAAIGERWYGAGKHINNFFYIYIGAGLGGGLFINGQLHSGFTGNAGEIGYYPIDRNGIENGKDYKPHLGEYYNLALLYEKLEKEGIDIQSLDDLKNLYEAGNQTIIQWFELAAEQLLPVLLSIEYLIDPEVIFIGGRLPEIILVDLLEIISEKLPELRIAGKLGNPDIRKSTAGLDAGALGVATLPLYATFAPIPKFVMDQSVDKIRNFTKSKN